MPVPPFDKTGSSSSVDTFGGGGTTSEGQQASPRVDAAVSDASPPGPPSRPHTPYDYDYHFLAGSPTKAPPKLIGTEHWEWDGVSSSWLTPHVSKLPRLVPSAGGGGGVEPLVLPIPDLSARRKKWGKKAEQEHHQQQHGNVLKLIERQDVALAVRGPSEYPSEVRLDQVGNWPFADQGRLMTLLEKTWKLGESRRLRGLELTVEMKQRVRKEVISVARVKRMYQDWLDSASFAEKYLPFTLSVPRRLTKKELLKLREVVYGITVRKLIHGFSHIREAFKIPPSGGDAGKDLDCLRELQYYHDYTMWASSLFYVLRSHEVRLTELEAMVVLELKLRLPTDTVFAIIDSHGDPSVYIPRNRVMGFDEFCLLAMPGLGEVQQVLRKEERARMRWEYEQKEREVKMGVVWERIKKRRIETKFDLETAFFIMQPYMDFVEHRTKHIIIKILAAGSKWWTAEQRRMFEPQLKKGIVLVDVKATLYRCVMEGVSMGGLKPNELARVFQHVSSVKLQTAFRCHSRYRKYQGVMRMCHRRTALLKVTVFDVFKKTLVLIAQLKKYCRRVVYRWRRWVKQRRVIGERFRLAHWPFHVWWRYTIKNLRARDKSRFLAGVFRMYLKLRAFNAIRKFSSRLLQGKRAVRPFLLTNHRSLFKEVMRCWHLYAREVHRLRDAWEAVGQQKVRDRRHATLTNTLTMWRYTSSLRKEVKVRAVRYFRRGYMDLTAYKDKLKKRIKEEQDRTKKEWRKSGTGSEDRKKTKRERISGVMEYLRRPMDLSLANTAWDTDRPARHRVSCLMPPFPYLLELPWAWRGGGGREVESHLVAHSKAVHQHYCQKDRRAAVVSYMRYRRLGPIALVRLRSWVAYCKKRRYAVIHASLSLERKAFDGWFRALSALASEKRERREQLERRLAEEEEMERLKTSDDPWHQLNELEKDIVVRKREAIMSEECERRTEHLVSRRRQMSEDTRQALKDMGDRRTVFKLSSEDLLTREAARGTEADRQALEWSKNFLQNAVESLVFALVRMQASLRHHQELTKTRRAFRHLRLLYIDAKSWHMYNFFRLRRQMDICRRYRRLLQGLPRFHALKTKYLCFRRWLSFLEYMYAMRTRGLKAAFKRRKALFVRYNAILRDEKLIGKHYEYHFLNAITSSHRSVFIRWVSYTQLQATFSFLSRKAREIHRYRFLRRVLSAWRTGMSPSSTYPFRQQEPLPFGEKRALADFDVARAWIVASDRASLVRNIRTRNQKRIYRTKKQVWAGPGFKSALRTYEEQIEQRMLVERSLLFDAFDYRGRMEYNDTIEPGMVGKGANEEKGKELGVPYATKDLPESHILQAIHVYFYKSRGVVGLGFTSSPGEFPRRTERLPVVGRSDGKCENFRLQPWERLVQIEIMAGIVIEQIRFRTSDGRLSRWLGRPINHALAVREVVCVSPLHDMSQCIVGLHGMADSQRILSIGLKVRHVIKEYLFTYNWVEAKGDLKIVGGEEQPGGGGEPATGDETGGHHQQGSDGDVVSTANDDKGGGGPASVASSKAPGLGSPEQEYVVLLAMRNVDLKELKARALRLSKKLWDTRVAGMEPLRRPIIVVGFMKWFFEALCNKVPHIAHEKRRGEQLVREGEKLRKEAAAMPAKAQEMLQLADQLEVAPRRWPTKGLVAAADREKENKYRQHIANLRVDADKIRKNAIEQAELAQQRVKEGERLLPHLCLEPRVRAYYRNLIGLVRAQSDLHRVFSGDAFKKFVFYGKTGDDGPGGRGGQSEGDSVNRVLQGALGKAITNNGSTGGGKKSSSASAGRRSGGGSMVGVGGRDHPHQRQHLLGASTRGVGGDFGASRRSMMGEGGVAVLPGGEVRRDSSFGPHGGGGGGGGGGMGVTEASLRRSMRMEMAARRPSKLE